MYMKQDNRNSISVIQRNLDESLRVNPIEDGNTPADNPHQGYMYTSEINDPDYVNAYKFDVNSIFSNKSITGNNSYYQIEVVYKVTDEGSYGGLFGNNLIKAGDTFILENDDMDFFNWVKGSVVAISNINVNSTNAPIITYTYTLACAFTEGLTANLPQGFLAPGQVSFHTDRRVFIEKDDKAPVNLLSSVRGNKVQFTWDDPTNKAIKYNFFFRSEDNTYNSGVQKVCGNHYNFNGKVKVNLKNDQIHSIKIVDPGNSISFVVAKPNVITSSNATIPFISFYNDGCGQLAIQEWEIIKVVSITSNSISCTVAPTKIDQLSPGPDNRMYVDFFQNKQLGEAAITNHYPIDFIRWNITIEYDNSYSYGSLTDAQNDLIGKRIKIHTGVDTNPGLDFNKEPILECDKYNENTKYVLNTTLIYSWDIPGPGTYYWKVASIFDCNEKSFTEWSQEVKLIIS